jgi:pilus assembly protein CpaB
MRMKSLFVTMFGLAVAGGSVMVARDFLGDTSSAALAVEEPQTATVLVARSDVEFGLPLEAHMIGTQQWPRDAVPAGAFTSLDQVVPGAGVEPRRAKARLYAGEVLLHSKVSDFGEKVTIVQRLGENTRAMAIRVNAETAVGGFVTPGDFVDIVLTQGGGETLRAVTILQNIRVIGVDQTSEEAKDRPEIARTITVEVSPEQGQKLALAQQAGTLSLTLRTLDRVVDAPLDMVELRDLLQEKSPVEDTQPKKPQIMIRRGVDVEAVDIN